MSATLAVWQGNAAANTVLEQRGALSPGDSVIDSGGSLYDAYSFQGQVGQQVTIRLQSSQFDAYLILLGPDGDSIAQSDDVDGSNTNAELSLALPEDGTYRAIANSYSSEGRGDYLLTITSLDSATTATSETAPPSASSSSSAEGTIAALPDGNYRYCDRQPPSSVVSEEYLTRNSIWCYLFNKAGNQVVGNFWDTGTFGEYGTCLTGSLDRNTVNGRVIDLPYGVENPTLDLVEGVTVFDTEGYLNVGEPSIDGDYIIFNRASLDLSSFYRYNVGSYSPPTSCR